MCYVLLLGGGGDALWRLVWDLRQDTAIVTNWKMADGYMSSMDHCAQLITTDAKLFLCLQYRGAEALAENPEAA
jgi:hypothetical protein